MKDVILEAVEKGRSTIRLVGECMKDAHACGSTTEYLSFVVVPD